MLWPSAPVASSSVSKVNHPVVRLAGSSIPQFLRFVSSRVWNCRVVFCVFRMATIAVVFEHVSMQNSSHVFLPHFFKASSAVSEKLSGSVAWNARDVSAIRLLYCTPI